MAGRVGSDREVTWPATLRTRAPAFPHLKGGEIEVLGWQASLKGSTDLYQVTFTARENRQGVRAELEANLVTGEVRAVNPVAQTFENS